MRLLRVLKLAKFWTGFERILKDINRTLHDVFYFGLIIYLFVLMFTVIGQDMYSNKIMFDDDGRPVPLDLIEEYGINNRTLGKVPDWNYDSFFDGNLVSAILLAGDGWTAVYFDFYRSFGPVSSLFFIL